MKKKITLKADIEQKGFIKKEVKQDVFLLEREFSISQKKEDDNKSVLKKDKAFLLKKEFKLIENKIYQKDNIFNLKKNTSKLLQIKKVSKSLGKRPILKNISLSLEPGKIVGLLGPNGSGKTTLFNLIIGKIFPDEGDILFNGEQIHNMPIHLRSLKGISLLEQHKGLFGNMTAEDNLYAILELHKKIRKKFMNELIPCWLILIWLI